MGLPCGWQPGWRRRGGSWSSRTFTLTLTHRPWSTTGLRFLTTYFLPSREITTIHLYGRSPRLLPSENGEAKRFVQTSLEKEITTHPQPLQNRKTIFSHSGVEMQGNVLLRGNLTTIFRYSACALRGPARSKTDASGDQKASWLNHYSGNPWAVHDRGRANKSKRGDMDFWSGFGRRQGSRITLGRADVREY